MARPTPTLSIVLLSALCLFALSSCGEKPGFSTDYQAVFMDNGQVFFGKIENTGGDYPLLRDVYYIGRQQSPDGKEVRNILIKRGNEWHSPEYMYVNKQHIVVLEPVAANSRVAQLIKEAKTQAPQQQMQPQAQPQPAQPQEQQPVKQPPKPKQDQNQEQG
jgi:hypothetical protein